RSYGDWSSDVCSSDLGAEGGELQANIGARLSLFHDVEKVIAEIVGATVAPRARIFLRAKTFERPAISHQGTRRNVALDLEVAQRSEERRVGKGWRCVR